MSITLNIWSTCGSPQEVGGLTGKTSSPLPELTVLLNKTQTTGELRHTLEMLQKKSYHGGIKVAEHSFCACFCTQGSQKKNKKPCRQESDHFIYSELFVLFFSIVECSALMALVLHVTCYMFKR